MANRRSLLVTIDFETYYDREYSLSKITTEEYIRSPLFETIGVAIKINDGGTTWYPQPQVASGLATINWDAALVLCQNTAFDGAILNWKYGITPLGYLDTMCMSRALFPHAKSHSLAGQATRMGVGTKGTEVLNALGKRYKDFSEEELERYGAYCRNDVDLTHALWEKYLKLGFPKLELRVIDLTLRMFVEPLLRLDGDMLHAHLADVQERKASLLDKVRDALLDAADPDDVSAIFSEGSQVAVKQSLMSNAKFADLLRSFGCEPPMKRSLTTGKDAYAFAKTDEEFKALSDHPNENVQTLVAARLGNKSTLEETRTERFIAMATRGAFPVPLRYYGAHSGRWSGQDSVNLQNLPSRGPNAGRIKQSILAPDGYVVIDCDSSQIEARVLAWLAGQDDLVDAFNKNNAEKLAGIDSSQHQYDVYKLMAQKIYNVPMSEITKAQRQVGKTVVLGCGYGVGHTKLQLFLKTQAGVVVDISEAKRIVDTYRASFYMIPDFWRRADAALTYLVSGNSAQVDSVGIVNVVPGKGLSLPNGLFIQYPALARVATKDGTEWLYESKGVLKKIYGGKVVENCCQAVARCVVAEQMLRISKRYRVVLTVHDSIAVVAPRHEAQEAQQFVEDCMRWAPTWAAGLPLACESGVGDSYGAC